MQKIILDVDTGVDDALAIIYGLESGKIDFLGITTVSGNVPVNMVTENTGKILQLVGREDIKVYPGASRPLLRKPHYEYHIHGSDGIGNALDHIKIEDENEEIFAADFIIQQAKKHQGELKLVMVGPLTNLALALRKEPKITEWIKEVIVMGGLVSKAGMGNKLPNSEFNIFADAEAAKIVVHSELEITLVSLDVTTKTFITRDDIERLKGTKYYDFVLKSTEVVREYNLTQSGVNRVSLHDPLTIGYLLNPSFLKTAKYFVEIEILSPLNYGQTICDFKNLWKKEANVNVCLDVDAKNFVNDFIETLKV